MKRIAFVCIMVLVLAFQLSYVSAFDADDVSISKNLYKIDVSIISDEDLGRMTLQVMNERGTVMLYIGQENSYTEEIKGEDDEAEYKYIFDSFNFPTNAATGTYTFKLSGNDGKIVSKSYSFVNTLDSFNFLNGLNAAEDVNNFLKTNQSISLVDLTSYLNLPQTVYSLVDSVLKNLDLAVEDDCSNLADKEQLFKEQFGTLMLGAEILASDSGEKWVSAVGSAKTILDLDTVYYDKLSDKNEGYTYFKKPASLSKEDIGKEFEKAVLIASLKQLDFGSVEDLLKYYEKKNIIELDRTVYETLSSTKKLKVCQRLKEDKNIIDVATLETEFKVISDQISKEKDTGGGGGTSSRKQDVTIIGDNKNDGNEVIPDNSQNDVFNDINEVPWAKGYILSLESRGILSGKGDGKFYPKESMLREEFVKVISVVCNLDIASENAAFSDVADGSWYSPYITACVNASIVNGIGDGKFGIGETITREDAAVMIVRALDYVGVEGTLSEEAFADERTISSYALESVKKLKKLGIISGDDNGNFMPKAAISRAEVSKMIYGMLDIIGG